MRSRGWCMTINNYTDYDIALLTDIDELQYRYCIIGFEIGDQGTPHLQVYIYYDNAIWFNKMKKIFLTAHIEAQKGSIKSAIEYCMKDEDYYEIGEKLNPGKLGKAKMQEIMENPWENFHLYCQYRKCYNELNNKEKKDKNRLLFLIKDEDRYTVAKQCDGTVCLYPSEYDMEEIYICPCYSDNTWIMDWLNGFPPKERYGYELRYKDPDAIYLTYSNIKEYNYLIKKYSDYIEFDVKKI